MNKKLAGLDIALIIVSAAIFGLVAWLGSMWGWQWLMWMGITFGAIQLMALVMPPLRNYMYIVPMTIAQKVSRYKRNKIVRQDPKDYIMWGAGFMAAAVGILIIVYSAKDSSDSELISIVLSPLFAVMVSLSVNRIGVGVYKLAEDATKQCAELAYLRKFYDEEKYLYCIKFDGESMPHSVTRDSIAEADRTVYKLLYDDMGYVYGSKIKISVNDVPTKQFVLPELAAGQYTELLGVHSAASLSNSHTVRLDKFEMKGDKEIVLYTSRSTFYSDLVTNRACDYRCADTVSLREAYEFGPHLVPLDRSVMSNHIGINVLVALRDGSILFPMRGAQGTMSKNKITSSIAVKMSTPEEWQGASGETGSTVIDAEYVQWRCVQLLAKSKLGLDVEPQDIRLIGMGRNIYDCGKPQFYYVIELGINSAEEFYVQHRNRIVEKGSDAIIDANVDIFACKLQDIRCDNGHMIINVGNGKKRRVKIEESCCANIYHYLKYLS